LTLGELQEKLELLSKNHGPNIEVVLDCDLEYVEDFRLRFKNDGLPVLILTSSAEPLI
jgi:hypothetical protein